MESSDYRENFSDLIWVDVFSDQRPKRENSFVEDESKLESSLVYLNKVVEVASKMANMAPRYSCHSSVQNAMMKQFTKLKSNKEMLRFKMYFHFHCTLYELRFK